MKTTLYACITFVIAQCLPACSSEMVDPEKHQRTLISETHNVFIDGGVLKVFADDEQNILYLYVRPGVLGHWVTAGGGGGNQDNPWLYKSALYWALGDSSGWYARNAPRKGLEYLFNSKDMTLTLETGTYAVRRGELIVISLDEHWQPAVVDSGVSSLKVFAADTENAQRLESVVRSHL